MRDTENKPLLSPPPPPYIPRRNRVPAFSLAVKSKNWQKESPAQYRIVFFFFSESRSIAARVKSKSKKETMGKVAEKGMGVAEGNGPSQRESSCFKK